MERGSDRGNAREGSGATLIMGVEALDQLRAIGRFEAECIRPDGTIRWRDKFPNTVTTVGKNYLLDQSLAGSAYTVTGPFVGFISSTSWSATSAADTMASHAGWLEGGGSNAPTYSGNRKTAAWASASAGSKALSAALAYSITGNGTIKGIFVVLGSGAVNTKDDTNGTLLSAGVFTGGDRVAANGDVVNVTYTMGI